MKNILQALLLFLMASTASALPGEVTQSIPLLVTEKGFEPKEIKVKSGTHVVLKITRKTDDTCATEIQVKEKKIRKALPLNKEVTVDLGILKDGEVHFACGMNMMTGHILAQ